tara:strand:+ start:1641 stop:3683 length:2043 start_codon:yes stop_codon:yes gene_type:complete
MLNSNKILNLISVILIFIIIYSIFNNTIYFNKYENFAVIPDFEDDFKDNPIYKKCPRGCGHHETVPNCEECGEDKPDYDKATLKEREWIDKYHHKGDLAKSYALSKIIEWKKINSKALFRFTFFYNKSLRSVNIHPNYQLILYEKYNPEKDNTNILYVTKWMEQLQLNLSDYQNFPQIDSTNNWTYIDIEPESWVNDVIFEIVMKNKFGSNQYYKTLDKSILDEYKIVIEDDNKKELEFDNNMSMDTSFSNFLKKKEEKIKKGLEKIFNACDINKDNRISNGEELRHISLAFNEDIRKNELDEVRKSCKSLGVVSCDNLNLTELWDKIYENLTDDDNTNNWTNKENYISHGYKKIRSDEVINAIEYLIKKELLQVNHNIINTDLEELKKLGVNDIDIKKSNRIIKNEESKLIRFVSKLRDINKLLNNYDKSINWDSQYNDIKERELTDVENNKIKKNEDEKMQSLKWKKYDISDNNYDINLISERRMINKTEYLKNIANPLEKSHQYATKRWKKYFKDGMNYSYGDKIIDNIKKGNGLHIDDIIWIFMYNRDDGMKYLNDLINKLKKLNNNTKKIEDDIEITLKPSCISEKKKIYNEVKLVNNSKEGLVIRKEQTFWPIFARNNDKIDINENVLFENNKDCIENTVCDKVSINNKGIECMFISKKAKINFDDKKPGEFWN